MFDNASLCRECNGQCCQRSAGCAFPRDFGLADFAQPDFTRLIAALNSGQWTIDKWVGDPRSDDMADDTITFVHFVRPRQLGDIGLYYDRYYGGTCVFWVDGVGCKLSANARPFQCQMLEPRRRRYTSPIGHDCVMHDGGDKIDAAIAWIPFNTWLWQFATSELRKVELTYKDSD